MINILTFAFLFLASSIGHASQEGDPVSKAVSIYKQLAAPNTTYSLREINGTIQKLEIIKKTNKASVQAHLILALAYDEKFKSNKITNFRNVEMIRYYQSDGAKEIIKEIKENLNIVVKLWNPEELIDHTVLVNASQSMFTDIIDKRLKVLLRNNIKTNYPQSFFLKPMVRKTSSKYFCSNLEKPHSFNNETKIHKETVQDFTAILQTLEFYYLDNRIFPSTEQGVSALVSLPKKGIIPQNWKGYLKKHPLDLSGTKYSYKSQSLSDGYIIKIWSNISNGDNCNVGISRQYQFIYKNKV